MCGGVESTIQKLDCDRAVVFTLWTCVSITWEPTGSERWGPTPEICVLTSLPGDADIGLKFEDHWTELCHFFNAG